MTRESEIKKIKGCACQVWKVCGLPPGSSNLATNLGWGRGEGFPFRVCSYVKVMWAGAGMGVSYLSHKERKLEFGCNSGEDVGVHICHKVKKIPAE